MIGGHAPLATPLAIPLECRAIVIVSVFHIITSCSFFVVYFCVSISLLR